MVFYKGHKFLIFIFCLIFLNGCAALKVTGSAIGTAGKVVYTTAKVTGKVAGVTAKAVGKTAVATGKGVRTVVNMATGKHNVKLTKRGNSLSADVLLNRKVKTNLIIDTGASDTVISSNLAKRIGISVNSGRVVQCHLADGRTVNGRQVNVREIRVGGARVYNAQAIVLDSSEIGENPGLLGMSFLDNFIFKVDTEKELLVLQKR